MSGHAASLTLSSLAGLPRWVAWQTEDRADGKPTKVPYLPRTRRRALANDPSTWGPRAAAEATTLPRPYGAGGVGIELGDLGCGSSLAGLDLDTCREPDGTFAPWAADILATFGTYAEVSPSGTGVKLFFLYDTADLSRLCRAMGTKTGKKWARRSEDQHPPGIELYLTGRFFAVTDQLYPGAPRDLRTVPTELLMRLIEHDGPAFAKSRTKSGVKGGGADESRSATALRLGASLRRAGKGFDEMCALLRADPSTAAWCAEKGSANGQRELRRIWDRAGFEPWQEGLVRDDSGQSIPGLANAAHALREAPELSGLVAYDQMLRHGLLLRSVPDSLLPKITAPRPIKDTDVTAVQEWLQRHGQPKMSREITQQAIDQAAEEQGFHPVHDYLNGLIWDRKLRIDRWLSYYLGVEASPYVSRIGRLFLVAIVQRHPELTP